MGDWVLARFLNFFLSFGSFPFQSLIFSGRW
jgi:hypothetical protein